MAEWTDSQSVVLHDTGRPALICAMVGSAVREEMRYQAPGGSGVPLDGWRKHFRAELWAAEWDGDDRLKRLVAPVAPVPAGPALMPDADQAANPGVFTLTVPDTLPPEPYRNAGPGPWLPTLLLWIRFDQTALRGVADQSRIAVGWRRGVDSG